MYQGVTKGLRKIVRSALPGTATLISDDPSACWRAEGLAAIDEYNEDLLEILDELRSQPFFRMYSVDLLKGCNYFPQGEDECDSQSCEIYPMDEDDVPEAMMAVDGQEHEFELDGWVRWDMPSEDYYDVYENREQFTGYDGSKIWSFIHEKICFPRSNFDSALGSTKGEVWQRDFNRAVSGLHSSINAHVVQGMVDKLESGEEPLDPKDGVTVLDPAAEYERRIGSEKAHLAHLFFGYMIMLCGVKEAASEIENYNFGEDTSGDPEGVNAMVKDMLSCPLISNEGVAVAEANLRRHAMQEGAQIWQARLRTRDLLRIMDCVQCNVCRLHGKVGALGLATALQVILGANGQGGDSERLKRVELAAMITTLGKFANAVMIVKEFEARKAEASG